MKGRKGASARQSRETMKTFKTKLINEKVEFIFIKKKNKKRILIFAHYLN